MKVIFGILFAAFLCMAAVGACAVALDGYGVWTGNTTYSTMGADIAAEVNEILGWIMAIVLTALLWQWLPWIVLGLIIGAICIKN